MLQTLKSNSAEIPFNARYFKPLATTSWRGTSFEELRNTFRRQGYLYLKGYLEKASILDLRSAYFSEFPTSIFKPGSQPGEGLFSGNYPAELPAHGAEGHPAHAFVRSDKFLRFAATPRLKQLSEILLHRPANRLRRTPLRHFIKGRGFASRAHIDFSYLDGGSAELITLWLPIGDCPLEAGGLIYLEDSQEFDLTKLRQSLPKDREHDQRPITHELRELSDMTGRRWLWTDFEAGDVIAHSPFIIHASTNSEIDLMRVSLDIRFGPQGEAADPRWSSDWSATDGF